jgi:hypothetical protein
VGDRRDFRIGDRIRVDASLEGVGHDGAPVSIKGDRGTVHVTNPTYEKQNGERFVAMQLDDGSICSVPARAVKKLRRGRDKTYSIPSPEL